MKKRVLFMPEGSVLAHVGRTIAIVRGLDQADIETCFAASGAHASQLQRLGKKVYPVYTRPRDALLARLKRGGSAFESKELQGYVEDELRVLQAVKPDLVVGDFRASLSISARVLRVPYVCVTNAVWTKYCSIRLDPPESWLLTKIVGKKMLGRVAPLIEKRVFGHYAMAFNRVRRSYGLPDQGDIRECMCSEDLNLLADVPEFFPSGNLPSNFRYVGPILWEPDEPEPEWLRELNRKCPIVYVTMGSTGPLELIRKMAEALAEQGLQVICTTATEDASGLPQGCYGVAYAPGGQLCQLADVIVCHAGNGTIYQALSRGKPVVGVPEFHDQEFNMQRVEALGLGCVARPGRRLLESVVEGVLKVLSSPLYRDRARDFQELLKGWNGAQKAASEITRFVSRARRVRPGARSAEITAGAALPV